MLAQQAGALGQRRVIGGDHAALAARHVLRRVEAEGAGAPGSAAPPVDLRPVALAGVLDHRQAVTIGDLDDGRHVSRLPVQADGHDRLGPRRDRGLDQGRVDREVVLTDVDEDRPCAGVEDAVRAGDEGERDGDHLVAGADPVRQQRQVQRGRPGARRDRVTDPDEGGEALLELAHACALRQ